MTESKQQPPWTDAVFWDGDTNIQKKGKTTEMISMHLPQKAGRFMQILFYCIC